MTNLLKDLPKIGLTPKIYLSLPETAGIYVFFKDSKPIYIGKAINLKRRVSSYFDINLEIKTGRMISEADELSFIQVESELEALLLEAKLIHTYMPKYNIVAKDDKHPLYIQITREKYPRIVTARKISEKQKNIAFYGPFPSTRNITSVLRMLRHIFPFSDHKIGKRACLYSHIGLCNPCPNEIEILTDVSLKESKRKIYLKNISNLKSVLDGNIFTVKTHLTHDMEGYSNKKDFENAATVRDQIQKLIYITQSQMPTEYYMENPNLLEDVRKKELRELANILNKYKLGIKRLKRVECFDVAHLAGANATASMVTFTNGEPDKTYYRHFRIRQGASQDDYASMKEVIARRKKHFTDWGRPDLVIVDGGKGQVSVFLRELQGEEILVIGLAKKFETLVIPTKVRNTINLSEFRLKKGCALNFVQRIRDEAHRFAREYHHKLFTRSLIGS